MAACAGDVSTGGGEMGGHPALVEGGVGGHPALVGGTCGATAARHQGAIRAAASAWELSGRSGCEPLKTSWFTSGMVSIEPDVAEVWMNPQLQFG